MPAGLDTGKRAGGGEPLPDPAAFSKRLSDVMRRALAA
jgi:hypothetical protein